MASQWNVAGVVERFRELVMTSDLSAAAVAEKLSNEFGVTLTRNSILGRVYRDGIKIPDEKRNKLKHRGAAAKTKRAHQPRTKAQTLADLFGSIGPELIDLPHDVSSCAKNILELIGDRSQCRWPVSTPAGELQLFCADRVVDGRPYCVRHCHTSYRIERPMYVSEAKRAA